MNLKSLLRFCVVGSICTALNLLVLYLAVDILKVNYIIACTIAFFTINFAGLLANRLFTFRSTDETLLNQGMKYYLTMGVSLGVNLGLMFILVSVLAIYYLVASLLVTVFLLFFNYAVHALWTFAKK